MVLHKYGEKLYQGLEDVVDQHLSSVATTVANAPDHNFLNALNEAWTEHDRSMLMIRDILMYMVCYFYLFFFFSIDFFFFNFK